MTEPQKDQKVDACVVPPAWLGWRKVEARNLHDLAADMPDPEVWTLQLMRLGG